MSSLGRTLGALRRMASALVGRAFQGASPGERVVIARLLWSCRSEPEGPLALFDEPFYRRTASIGGGDAVHPFVHYLRHGVKEGGDPHPLFDSRYYLECNPDVAKASLNPLLHYLRHGAREGRNPHPLFDAAHYARTAPGGLPPGANPLVHYLTHAATRGGDPHPLFSTRYYCRRNPDVVRAGFNPLVHYVRHGSFEGRRPHPLFDPELYGRSAGDPRAKNPGTALLHSLVAHASEAADPHPFFDTRFYTARHGARVPAGTSPLVHFVLEGAALGLTTCPEPDPGVPNGPPASSRGRASPPPRHDATIPFEAGEEPVLLAIVRPRAWSDVDEAASDPLVVALRLLRAEGWTVFVAVRDDVGEPAERCHEALRRLGLEEPPAGLPRSDAVDAVLLDESADRAAVARVLALHPEARLLLALGSAPVTDVGLLDAFDGVLSADQDVVHFNHLDLSPLRASAGRVDSDLETVAERALTGFLRRGGLGPGRTASDRLLRLWRARGAPRKEGSDLVVLSLIPWHYRRQRPQHLSAALGRRGRRVVYVEPTFLLEAAPRAFRVEESPAPNVLCASLRLPGPVDINRAAPTAEQAEVLQAGLRALCDALGLGAPTLLLQAPFWLPACRALPRARIVYDCMDLYASFPNVSREIAALQQELFRTADLVVLTAAGLLEGVPGSAPCEIVRNACEFERFARASPRRTGERPTIGYVGAIESWFDVELVDLCARSRPEWTFVLAGAVHGLPDSPLPARPNVRLLGEVDYADVPGLVAGFDVCVIPFRLDELTRCVNPVKVYEYLAAGKPVVATALPELLLLDAGLVHVADSHASFLQALERAVRECEDPALRARRAGWAGGQTWDARAEELARALDR
jgi:glycosyltransferase involved in cell wall biosynthesis